MLDAYAFEFTTRLYFRCPLCGVANTIDVEVADFNSPQKSGETVHQGPIVIECENCENDFDGTSLCNESGCTITLDRYPDLKFYGDAPSYATSDEEYWLDYEPPENPYKIFLETYHLIIDLLDHRFHRFEDPQIVTRMIFVQLISAMEAYLGDKLIFHTLESRDNMDRLIHQDRNLIDTKISLSEIIRNESVLETTVKRYLRSILYHNLERVRFVYKSALSFDIFTNDADWKILLIAINNRHDCAHRNGATVDGQLNRIFTRTYVRRVGQAIERLANHIEVNYPPKASPDPWRDDDWVL